MEIHKSLNCLSNSHILSLHRNKGFDLIKDRNKLFPFIECTFDKYATSQINNRCIITPFSNVDVYETTKDMNYCQMFSAFGKSFGALCLTQSQVIEFVSYYPSWLATGICETFFLIQPSSHFLLIHVTHIRKDGRLYVGLDDIGRTNEWVGGIGHRIVVPKLRIEKGRLV